MNSSLLKIVQSRFLPSALLFVFVPVFIWGYPAEIPYRLDKAVVDLIGDVHAEICVEYNDISIEVPASDSGGGGSLLGVLIVAGIDSARNNDALETVAPLKKMIKDIDFHAALQAALFPMLKEISWPRIIDLQARDGAALSRKKDILIRVNEGSFLDIYSSYQFSPNVEVLRMSTGFTLYLKGSAKAAVAGTVSYSSARIGKFDINDEAIALWAENGGAAYRLALNQGIEDTVKMLNCALLNAGGKSAPVSDSKLRAIKKRTKYEEDDYGPKQKGTIISGWIIEENDNRILFQSGAGSFISIPRSDIISEISVRDSKPEKK